MSGTPLIDPSLFPSGGSYLAPWFSSLLPKLIASKQSPYLFTISVVKEVFFPTDLPRLFSTALWIACGLFSLSTLIVLLGLFVRLVTHRFWLFHRIDSTVIIPNTSTLYGICSLVYTGLGVFVMICAIKVGHGEDYPRYYDGARLAWIGPLWLAIYFECWGTLAAWYIRKKGPFYNESLLKSILATTLPFLLPLLIWAPPSVLFTLAARNFNASFRASLTLIDMLEGWQQDWSPSDPLDIPKLAQLAGPGGVLGEHIVDASTQSRSGSAFCCGVLLVTLVVYVVGTYLELAHLTATVAQLRAEAYSLNNQHLRRRRRSAGNLLDGESTKSPTTPTSPRYPRSVSPSLAVNLGGDEQLQGERPWTLLAWVRRNRIYSATCIALLLVVNAGLELWRAMTKRDLRYPSGLFQVELLVDACFNGVVTTLVALLLLFRSLDHTTSPFLSFLRTHLPFLPFPPILSTPETTTAGRSDLTTQPPLFLQYGGNTSPVIERVGTKTLPPDGGEHVLGTGAVLVSLAETRMERYGMNGRMGEKEEIELERLGSSPMSRESWASEKDAMTASEEGGGYLAHPYANLKR